MSNKLEIFTEITAMYLGRRMEHSIGLQEKRHFLPIIVENSYHNIDPLVW
jgi:hypothetical protein